MMVTVMLMLLLIIKAVYQNKMEMPVELLFLQMQQQVLVWIFN